MDTLTKKEFMLRYMRGDYDKMSALPDSVKYRMRAKGWFYGHSAQAWLRNVYPRDAHDTGVRENGSPEWRRDVRAAFHEAGTFGKQKWGGHKWRSLLVD